MFKRVRSTKAKNTESNAETDMLRKEGDIPLNSFGINLDECTSCQYWKFSDMKPL